MSRHVPPLVLSVFPTFAVGGAQVRFCALANRFGPRWRHAIVALDGRSECASRLGREVPFELLPSPARRGDNAMRNLPRIVSMLRSSRPDVLVTSNWGSMEWATGNLVPPRVRHLHMEDGFGPDESSGQLARRVAARSIALRWSTVAVPSTTLLRVAKEAWRLPARRLRHIPNGIDLARFRPDGPADAAPSPGIGPLVGTVAALRPEKNVGRLLRAAALLLREGTTLRLAVIGDGAERPRLEALAAELGIAGSVLFTGHAPDPAASYRSLDVFALSSDTEQMPFSVLEAMATGLPVAATDVGDVRAMLAEANLPHISALGDAALASALRPLLRDGALRSRVGEANRRKAERDYDQETMFRTYAALLDGEA